MRDENIDSCTLKWKGGYRRSHSPMAERIFTVTGQAAGRAVSGAATLGLSRHRGQLQRQTCVLGPHGDRKLADRESVTFSCSKGPSFGDCKDLRIAVSEELGE